MTVRRRRDGFLQWLSVDTRIEQQLVFLAVEVALLFLPAFAGNGYVFAGILALPLLWWLLVLRHRLRAGDAGPLYAQQHPEEAPPIGQAASR